MKGCTPALLQMIAPVRTSDIAPNRHGHFKSELLQKLKQKPKLIQKPKLLIN